MSVFADIRMEARDAVGTGRGLIGPPVKTTGSYDDDGLVIDYHRKCLHPGCDVNLTSRTRWERRILCIEHGREMLREKSQRRRRAAGVPTREEMSAAAAAKAVAAAAAEERPKAAPIVRPKGTVNPADKQMFNLCLPDAIAGLPILPKDLQAALAGWLQAPGEIHTEINLRTAMREYELKARLRRVLPPEAVPALAPRPPPVFPGKPMQETFAAMQRAIDPCHQAERSPRTALSIPVYDPGDELTNPNHRFTHSEFISDADHYGA